MSNARVRSEEVPAKAPKVFIWGACEACGTSKRFSPRDGGASTPSVPENARRGTHA
jgi:hypothetical protein